jgi:hypothetical protein
VLRTGVAEQIPIQNPKHDFLNFGARLYNDFIHDNLQNFAKEELNIQNTTES